MDYRGGLGILLITLALTIIGCANQETPAGSEGYVTRGAMIGETTFYGIQKGPTSTGLGWMLEIDNVDMRWTTTDEEFNIQSADNIDLTFKAHITWRPTPGEIKKIVEVYGGKECYVRFLQQPFRNAVYDAVSKAKALEAKDDREKIALFINTRMKEVVDNKPFEVQRVVIGAIDFPKELADAQNRKIATETQLQAKQFEIDIATKDAQKRIEEAKGIAQAQTIINASLTPLYLQHEAIKAQEAMANSPNHTTVYIPSGSSGIPLIKIAE